MADETGRVEAAARAIIGAEGRESIGSAWRVVATAALAAADAHDCEHGIARIRLDDPKVATALAFELARQTAAYGPCRQVSIPRLLAVLREAAEHA